MKKAFFLAFAFILILPLVSAHVVPYSNLWVQTQNNALLFEVISPAYCTDTECLTLIPYNYSAEVFDERLILINEGSKCYLNPARFLTKFDKESGYDTYVAEYICEKNINLLNITNTLFYEIHGFYFEQYYVLNCEESKKIVYTDIVTNSVLINFSEICSSEKNIFMDTNNPQVPNMDYTSEENRDSFLLKNQEVKTGFFSTADIYNRIVKASQSKNMLLIVILLSILFGVLHSFSPGHGKTLILSYLLGGHARTKDVLLLAGTTALTHVSDILILSLAFLFLPASFKTQYINYITIIAAVLIIVFGLKILIDNLKKKHNHTHSHIHTHDHIHFNEHAENHEHNDEVLHEAHSHHHTHLENTHEHPHSHKKTITAGFLAGLAPCPTAWALFSVLIALKLYFYAFISVVSFSFGLILAILIISMLFMKAKGILKFIPEHMNGYNYLRIASGALITLVGLFMLLSII